MKLNTPHTVSQGAGVLLGNFGPTSTGSTRDLILETNKDTEALKSVYDMRVSHSNMNTRPMSKPKGKRKHLQSAVTRTMAPKLTMPDDSELSGANLLPPMAPSIHRQPNQTGTQTRLLH